MTSSHTVVFVAPFFQETTLRLASAAAAQPGVRLVLISQDPLERLPTTLREALAAHQRVQNGLDVDEIGAALEELQRHTPVHRILGALEELQVPLADLRERFGIAGMRGEAARNFRDKARMKTVLRSAGIPCARHALVTEADGARAFLDEVGYPVVAKPPAGSGARSTFRLESPDQLEDCLRSMPPTDARPLLLEEFMTGTEHSFDSVCLGGDMVWHSISHYAPAPLDVLREPWIQWTVMIPREVERPEYAAIQEAAPAALKALGMDTGLSHMEWFRRPDGSVAISEVGARPPGAQIIKLISYAHDFDLYNAWARLMIFDTFEPRERPYAVGAAYLRGQGRGTVQGVTGIKTLYEEIGDMVVEHRLPQPGQSPSGTYEGDGYIIVRHPETSVVESTLRDIVSRVRVVLG